MDESMLLAVYDGDTETELHLRYALNDLTSNPRAVNVLLNALLDAHEDKIRALVKLENRGWTEEKVIGFLNERACDDDETTGSTGDDYQE